MVIRRQTAADGAAVRAMLARLGDEGARRRFFGRFVDFAEEAEHVGLVAVEERAVIGHAALRRIGPFAAEMAVEVVEGRRGQGIGTRLAEAAVEAAREAGMQVLIAEVQPDNAAMLRVLTATGVPLAVTDVGDHLLVELEL